MNQFWQKVNLNSTFFTSIVSIILGIIIGAIVMLMSGYDPISAYQGLFVSSLVQPYDLGETIRATTPLILTGLAVALAFRTGLFNIGVEGQFMVGQLAAVVIGLQPGIPPVLHTILAVLAGGLAGALWGAVPGILKATRGVHEVIVSIMMNFIALNLSNMLIRTWLAPGQDSTARILPSASLRLPYLSELFGGARVHLSIVIALIAAFVMYYLLWRTRLGYELRAVGYNPSASEYAGMSVKRNIILSMMISGAFAGLAGAGELLGTSEYLPLQSSFSGYGFDGIAVALLGANTPIGVILSAILFGTLNYGGSNMQFDAGVPFEVIRIIFAAIILFVAANVTNKIATLFRSKREKKGVKSGA